MTCEQATATLERHLRDRAIADGEPWTEGLVAKTSTLDTQRTGIPGIARASMRTTGSSSRADAPPSPDPQRFSEACVLSPRAWPGTARPALARATFST